MEAEKS